MKDKGKSSKVSNSRTGWAPLLVKVGGSYSLVVMWKNFRGFCKLYSESIAKESIFGIVKRCSYTDGLFHLTDDLGKTIQLQESQLDASILGGKIKLAIHLSNLRSQGELAKLARYLEILGNLESESPVDDFFKTFVSEAKESALSVNKIESEIVLDELKLVSNIKRKSVQKKEKLSKQAKIEKFFTKENKDPKGFETVVKKSSEGRVDVHLDRLEISENL